MVDVKHFRLLQAIDDHGTVSGAARALGFSQPAVSQQVKSLERTLRVPVVMRAQQGIVLTEVGKILLRHGDSILTAISLAEAEVSAVAGLRAGHVRVASFPSGAASLLSGAMSSLKVQHPELRLSLTELGSNDALSKLRSGDCDVALVFDYGRLPRPNDERGLVRVPLLKEHVRVVLASDHPMADLERVSLLDLRHENWIAGCPKCRGHLLATCERAGFAPDIAFETDDYVALQSLASRGLGVALLPDLILSVVRLPSLRVKRFDPLTCRQISVVSTPDLIRMPAVNTLLEALVQAASQIEQAWKGKGDANDAVHPLTAPG